MRVSLALSLSCKFQATWMTSAGHSIGLRPSLRTLTRCPRVIHALIVSGLTSPSLPAQLRQILPSP